MKLVLALLALVLVAGCVGTASAKTVAQVTPQTNELPQEVTLQTHTIIAAGSQSSTAETEEDAEIDRQLDMPDGLSAEDAGIDPGELPGLVEKGTYFIKKDGETVLMLLIGRFKDEETASQNYGTMKVNMNRKFQSSWPGANVEETKEALDLGPFCTGSKRTMTVTPPEPQFEWGDNVPPGTPKPEFEQQSFTYSMEMAICQKGVFMIGVMGGQQGSGSPYMKPVVDAVLRKA